MNAILLFEDLKKQDELYCNEIKHLYIPQYEFFNFHIYKFRIRGNFTFEDVLHYEGDRYMDRVEKEKIVQERRNNAKVVYDMIRNYIYLMGDIFMASEEFFYKHKEILLNPKFMSEIKIHIYNASEYSTKVRTGEKIEWIGHQDFLYNVMIYGSTTTF